MKQIETKNYRRVTKRTALKLASQGKDIYVTPCNFNPESPWGTISKVNLNTFNENIYKAYNCTCNETGWRIAYYIRKVD